MCVVNCLKIGVLVCSVILILLAIAYFVWISQLDNKASDYGVAVFLYLLAVFLLWVLAAIGIYGAVKEHSKALLLVISILDSFCILFFVFYVCFYFYFCFCYQNKTCFCFLNQKLKNFSLSNKRTNEK